jgi:hypothetical protein
LQIILSRKNELAFNLGPGPVFQKIRGEKMKKLTTAIIILGILIAAPVYKASPIPEPVAMVMLGVGLIGLAGLARKKFLKKL